MTITDLLTRARPLYKEALLHPAPGRAVLIKEVADQVVPTQDHKLLSLVNDQGALLAHRTFRTPLTTTNLLAAAYYTVHEYLCEQLERQTPALLNELRDEGHEPTVQKDDEERM